MTAIALSAFLLLASADTAAVHPQDTAAAAAVRPDSASEAKLRAAQAAWDRSAPSSERGASVTATGLLGALAQILAGLGFLALVGAGGFLVVRKARGRSAPRSVGSQMDLLETIPAGPGARVSLVRIHDRVVAVAFSGAGAAAVAAFSGPQAAEILADSGPGRSTVKDFATSLEGFMERFRKQPPAPREEA